MSRNVGDPVQSCQKKKANPGTIEFKMVDEAGKPLAGHRYRIELPDDNVSEGIVGEDGTVKLEGVEKGSAKISFPDLDAKSWDVSSG